MEYNPVCIFAESTTTNGKALLKFKRGAFMALRTVQPVVAKIGNRYIMPTYEVMPFWPLLFMFFASFTF